MVALDIGAPCGVYRGFALSPTLTIPETIFAVDTNTSSDFFVSVISRVKPSPETIPVSPT